MTREKLRTAATAMMIAILMVAAAPAGAATKKRAVKPGTSSGASLSGRITDAAGGAGISGVLVSTQDKGDVSGSDGRYTLSSLNPGTATITIDRFGYASQTRTIVLLAGSNTLNVSLSASATVTVVTTDNLSRKLVIDTVMFSSNPGGLVSPRNTPTITLCGSASATPVTYDKSEISLITGPTVASTGCCAIGQQLNFTLRNGQKFDATFADSCAGYTLDLVGRNPADGLFVYLSFKNIKSVQFP